MEKYLGRKVVIVYQDRKNRFTQRTIKVLAVDVTNIKAYCYTSNASRTFIKDQILAMKPVTGHAIGY